MERFDFQRLAEAITAAGDTELAPEARFVVPSAPRPFIPPKLLSDQSPDQALAAEVIVVSSPAAVGKTTAARYLAATSNLPLLNLADVHVSTNALVGLLTTDVARPANPIDALHSGQLSLIIDALDEGRMLSGDANFEKFLETSWELLRRDRSEPDRPKLVLFGRELAAELVELSLLTLAEDLRVSWVKLDFFDARDAMEVVEAHASETARLDGRVWTPSPATRAVVQAFFQAIASALKVSPDDLWLDPQGRAFSGYAPILAAIGSLISRQDNPVRLKNALEDSGAERAWDVIESVADAILTREQEEKVHPQLVKELSGEVPAEAYDPAEQLTYLTQLAHGREPQLAHRFGLSGKDLETYRRIVGQQLPEHPFLQGGSLANDVLASIVFAHAVGNDLLRDSDSAPLRQASRQPFLWRSVQRHLERFPETWLVGNHVGRVLNSLWNDSVAEVFQVVVRPDETEDGMSVITIEEPEESWRFRAVHPIEFYEQLRTADCQFRSDVSWQGHRGDQGSEVFDVRGDVTFVATAGLEIRAETVRLDGDVRLMAKPVIQPGNLRVVPTAATRVWWGGEFASTHPWNQYAPTLESPEERLPATKLEALLERLDKAFPAGAPITVYKFKLRLTDDRRTSWISRDFGVEEFAKLLDLMVQEGLARTEDAETSGPRPMVRVHFSVTWAELLRGLRHPEKAADRVSKALAEARRIFR